MLAENFIEVNEKLVNETLETFIKKDFDYKISYNAQFTGFKHRSKVEFLRFFIV